MPPAVIALYQFLTFLLIIQTLFNQSYKIQHKDSYLPEMALYPKCFFCAPSREIQWKVRVASPFITWYKVLNQEILLMQTESEKQGQNKQNMSTRQVQTFWHDHIATRRKHCHATSAKIVVNSCFTHNDLCKVKTWYLRLCLIKSLHFGHCYNRCSLTYTDIRDNASSNRAPIRKRPQILFSHKTTGVWLVTQAERNIDKY